jgi:redox-sensitive bicupin YhaK (pirin superfamily)
MKEAETGGGNSDGAVQLVLAPRPREIDEGFEVRRALPSGRRRMVGPFIFFDQMGPALLEDDMGLDVRPHPHIGLATLTYLFAGELLHRDSLGTIQLIRPGEANWMTAGRGIAHSERTPPERRRAGERLFGIQCWLALPRDQEECEPSFDHVPAEALPEIAGDGFRARVIAGELEGRRSPIVTHSPAFYVDVDMQRGGELLLSTDYEERALYVAEGEVALDGHLIEPGQLAVLRPGVPVAIEARRSTRMMLLGGEPIDGPRHIWWNFVSSSRQRIEEAKADWRESRFAPVPEESEFIPLPDEPRPAVRYP